MAAPRQDPPPRNCCPTKLISPGTLTLILSYMPHAANPVLAIVLSFRGVQPAFLSHYLSLSLSLSFLLLESARPTGRRLPYTLSGRGICFSSRSFFFTRSFSSFFFLSNLCISSTYFYNSFLLLNSSLLVFSASFTFSSSSFFLASSD